MKGLIGMDVHNDFNDINTNYQTLFDKMSDTIVIHNTEQNITSCNRAFCELFGYTRDQIAGKSIRIIFDSDKNYETFCEKTATGIRKGNTFRGEWYFVRNDGTPFPMEIVISAIYDDNGVKTGYFSIGRDITERRKTEDSLKESEERYRIAIEHSNDGVAIVKDFVHIYVNNKLAEMFGYESPLLITGKSIALLVHPDDRSRILYYVEQRQGDGIAPSRYEFKGIKSDGNLIYIEASVTTITYHGEKDILVYMRDNTERKLSEEALRESEEKYRLLIEHATDSIFIIQDGVIKFPNPKTEEKLGYTGKELEQMPFIDHVHSADKEMVLEKHRRRINGEETTSTYSCRIINRDGTELWGEVSSVVIDWQGKPASLVFIRDITEQKKLESQLFQAQKMEAIGTLAGGIAHDFNNLLMGIQGNASLLLYNLDPAHPHYEKLKQIQEHVMSGADLTKQLLGFARGGRYEAKPSDLNDIIKKSSTMFGRTKKEIAIHRKLRKDLWIAEIDPGQIEQVLLNLYVNAWQAMPLGGSLYIETNNIILDRHFTQQFDLKEGNYVKIVVTDTGVGMDEKTKERIFEPFFTTKEMGRGTGLGLASAYGIVKGHKGIINVYSAQDHGTTFSIYLPASEKEAQKNIFSSEEIIKKGTETILLVDDEEQILKVSSEILLALGYKILTARNGREAVDLYSIHNENIDLVVLDMIMPDMGGGETFAFLKMINPLVKAILSSGYSLNEQAKDIVEQGCKGFIQKPFTIQALSQKIREVLDKK
ncbi:MAG: hypothetical protein C0392_10165 [Syntrophus sp. (in: bacteria)]|nr:hypothetical protein [Syntrophus sp. (in: bacteria)]